MTIEAVVFDIGNVLVKWDPDREFDRLIGPDRRRALFAEIDMEGINRLVDLGTPLDTAVEGLAARHPDRANEIRLWRDHWLDMCAPAIPHSARLLRALRAKGVPVYALSNFGTATLDLATEHYPFLTDFDRRFVSGHLRTVKPDAEIYAILERDTGHDPDTLLFADDRAENIAAAEARGWQGHLFVEPQGWADRLVAEGLLSRDEAA